MVAGYLVTVKLETLCHTPRLERLRVKRVVRRSVRHGTPPPPPSSNRGRYVGQAHT